MSLYFVTSHQIGVAYIVEAARISHAKQIVCDFTAPDPEGCGSPQVPSPDDFDVIELNPTAFGVFGIVTTFCDDLRFLPVLNIKYVDEG